MFRELASTQQARTDHSDDRLCEAIFGGFQAHHCRLQAIAPTIFQSMVHQEDDADKLERNDIVIAKRKSLYGSWDKQLEEINEQGLDTWKARIAQIKSDNPKE